MVHRIRANRTPLLIRTPWTLFLMHYGHFWHRSMHAVFWGKYLPKMTIEPKQKFLNFNRTRALYLRGYGNYIAKEY